MGFQLPTSTSERRISEPSTVRKVWFRSVLEGSEVLRSYGTQVLISTSLGFGSANGGFLLKPMVS